MSTFFDQLDRERKLQAERPVYRPIPSGTEVEYLHSTVARIDNFLSEQPDNKDRPVYRPFAEDTEVEYLQRAVIGTDNFLSGQPYYGTTVAGTTPLTPTVSEHVDSRPVGHANISRSHEVTITGNTDRIPVIGRRAPPSNSLTAVSEFIDYRPQFFNLAQQLAPLRTEVNPEENLQTIPPINIVLRDWESLDRPRENITNNPVITYSDDESEQDIPPLADENGDILPSSFTFRDNPVIPTVALLHTGQVMEMTGNDTIWPRPMFTQSVRSNQTSALLSKLASLTDEQVAEEDSSLACVTCYVNKKIIALNCGHLKTCATCTSEIIKTGGKCPVCREKIVSVMRIYD